MGHRARLGWSGPSGSSRVRQGPCFAPLILIHITCFAIRRSSDFVVWAAREARASGWTPIPSQPFWLKRAVIHPQPSVVQMYADWDEEEDADLKTPSKAPLLPPDSTPDTKAYSAKTRLTSSPNEHLKTCRMEDCARCLFIGKTSGWMERLPMIFSDLGIDSANISKLSPEAQVWARKSWLSIQDMDGGWGIGCVACAHAGKDTLRCRKIPENPYAKYSLQVDNIQLCNLLKHHSSVVHKQNTTNFLGLTLGLHGEVLDVAPEEKTFKEAWDRLTEGMSLKKGIPGVCGERKLARITTCLAEARWAADRDFVRKACCLALHRDERKGRILIRYKAVDKDLNVRAGILGHLLSRPGALGICAATIKILDKFCTERSGKKTNAGVLDKALRDHIVKITEAITVDSASDELLACSMLANGSSEEMEQVFTNHRVIIRDTTHASRKICERSIKATLARHVESTTGPPEESILAKSPWD